MPLFDEQIVRNKALLESIQKHGLTPRRDTSIGVVIDDGHKHLLCYNAFNTDRSSLEKNLKAICYEDISGLWSIGIEGVGVDPKKMDVEKINAGLRNSIVFLFKMTPDHKKKSLLWKPLGNGLLLSKEPIGNSCIEYRTKTPIDFKEILAILVPRHLMPLMRKQFPQQSLIPVDDVKQSVTSVPWMATPAATKGISKTVALDIVFSQSNYFVVPQDLVGPNYMQGLREFIALHSVLTEVGIHLTRLYTPAMCKERIFTVTNGHQTRVTIPFSTSKEDKQQLGVMTLLLKNLKPEAFQFLSTHPYMTLVKHSLVANSYYLYCNAKYKPLLSFLINQYTLLQCNTNLIATAYRIFSKKRLNTFFKSKNDTIISLKNDMQALLAANDFAGVAQKALEAKAANEKLIEVETTVSQKGALVASASLR